MKARLLANLNWLFADKVLRLAGGLIIGVWTARYLGPEQFGNLNYAIAFVALFGAVAKLGIDQIVVRDLVRMPDKQPAILGTVLVMKLVASLVALAVVIPIAWLSQQGNWDFTLMVGVIAAGMLFNVLDAYDIYYQAHVRSRDVVFARGIAFLVFAAVRVSLILGGFSIIYFALAATLELAVGGGVLVWVYRCRQVQEGAWYFDSRVMKSLFRDGWPFIVSSALVVIHTRVDQVMIGQMMGVADVGIYSAAVRLSESWLFVPGIIVQTLTPYFMALRASNLPLYRDRLMQLYSIMFWLSVSVGLMTMVLGEVIVVTLFGESYRASYQPLVLTVWTGVFISQSVARSIWMVGENMQKFRVMNNVMAVPLNIIFNLVMIPRYGVVGASAASLLSIGISTWILPFLFASMRESNRQLIFSINPVWLLRSSK